ncbi:MAG: hypothetical protein M1818_000547 [Claussenomyces sp. TS43310]|nr:MAG: hypothetical protein M1818_000547 [Claussenomyces sp. TS43310]
MFPGLKMLSGDNNARQYDSTTMTWGNSSNPSRPVADRVSFVCINYDNLIPQSVNLTNMNCPQGFRAQIQMQTCWDGVNLYESDQSHVAYLNQIDNGACPMTHPILLPHLFYEVFYSVDSYTDGSGTFVFANGDTTGYGFHGDFINGWDIPTLTEAIDTCLEGNEDGVVEYCAALNATNVENFAILCPETSPVFPCEQVHGTLNALPGCITPTGYGHVELLSDNTCASGTSAACSPNYANKAPGPYCGNSAWSPIGCWTEATDSRALKDESYTSTTNMTAESCLTFCSKYNLPFAGVEYGQECYCGSVLQAGSALTAATDCNMACTGNQWETCGAGSRLQVFKANVAATSSGPSSTATSSSSPTKLSSSINTIQSSASSASSASSTFSTRASTSTGSSAPSPTTAPALSTKYPSPPNVAGYRFIGCYSDNVSGRALQATYMYGSYQGSAPLTLERCAAYCETHAGGPYAYFGAEYTNECYCGNAILGSNALVSTQDDCSSTCGGNTTEYCGAGNRLNMYSLTPAATGSGTR